VILPLIVLRRLDCKSPCEPTDGDAEFVQPVGVGEAGGLGAAIGVRDQSRI